MLTCIHYFKPSEYITDKIPIFQFKIILKESLNALVVQ